MCTVAYLNDKFQHTNSNLLPTSFHFTTTQWHTDHMDMFVFLNMYCKLGHKNGLGLFLSEKHQSHTELQLPL